jgi:hypothetical protein
LAVFLRAVEEDEDPWIVRGIRIAPLRIELPVRFEYHEDAA